MPYKSKAKDKAWHRRYMREKRRNQIQYGCNTGCKTVTPSVTPGKAKAFTPGKYNEEPSFSAFPFVSSDSFPFSYGGKREESIDEMLDKLDKQDIQDIKKEELKSRIRTRAAEAEQKCLELQGKGKVEPKERRFTIIDNKPVPDPEGEYTTFTQALRTCAPAGEKAGIEGEKVSEILTAIQPFVIKQEGAAKEAEEKKVETSVAVAAIEALKERGDVQSPVAVAAIDALSKERGGNVQAQQPLTITDMLEFLDKLNEMKSAQSGGPPQRSMVDELAQLGSTVKVLQEVFGDGKSEGQAPVYVTLPSSDAWDDHRWNGHKDEQKFQDSRENARVRDFVGKLGKAATTLSS